MNLPRPAIVAQAAVRRLPRAALLLVCAVYVIAGFVGRAPWRNADIAAFGLMAELAGGGTGWRDPRLMDEPPEVVAHLPYWAGAVAIRLAPAAVPPDLAVRLPFALMLVLALVATWYAVYHLARHPGAQPVAFAFGGEARPTDYARALADGGLLALIACLGLAQLAHETTPAVSQLAAAALVFFGFAAASTRPWLALGASASGLPALALSGAPAVATGFGLGALVLALVATRGARPSSDGSQPAPGWPALAGPVLGLAAIGLLGTELPLWAWRLDGLPDSFAEWRSLGRLFLWFTWPAWPLVLWTLWHWRRQLRRVWAHPHLALPLWLIILTASTAILGPGSDRALLVGLPAFAALAAFALPTLGRSIAALVDWFTLLFFSGCAFVIWVIWIAMQTGFPSKPAANVARLAPGFEPGFSPLPFVLALAATLLWIGLVRWRAGRHRAAIWKSLVLPAGGAVLCWLLLMSLWLPLLDYARSHTATMRRVSEVIGTTACVKVHGLGAGEITALRHHSRLTLRHAHARDACDWLVTVPEFAAQVEESRVPEAWTPVARIERPTDRRDVLLVYRLAPPARP